MSQAQSLDKLEITSFNINSIKPDQHALKEYQRLQTIYDKKIYDYLSFVPS